MRNIYLYLSLVLVGAFSGCIDRQTAKERVQTNIFDHPQHISFLDDVLIILNSGYSPVQWNGGKIVLVDMESNDGTYSEIQTAALNPQSLMRWDNRLMIISTGEYDFSDFDNPRTLPPFGIELYTQNDAQYELSQVIQLPEEFNGQAISAPLDAKTIGLTTMITSGLNNILWRIRWESDSKQTVQSIDVIKLDGEFSTGLTSIETWQDYFVITEFNTDQLYLIESSTGDIHCQQQLGRSRDEMEGLQTPLVIEDELYLTFALSGRMEAVSLQPLLNECTLDSRTLDITLGQIPNDLDYVHNELWVTMSGENHILRLNRETGNEIDRIVLPVGSNPWSFDFNSTLQLGAISLWASNDVQIVDANGVLQLSLNEQIRDDE